MDVSRKNLFLLVNKIHCDNGSFLFLSLQLVKNLGETGIQLVRKVIIVDISLILLPRSLLVIPQLPLRHGSQ